MASLRRHGSGPYHLELRFAGRKLQRSLRTKSRAEANRLRAIVERTAEYLDLGVLTLPPGTSRDQLWHFLISGGKVVPAPEPTILKSRPFADVCDDYLVSYAEGGKETSTLKTERRHLSLLQRLLGCKVLLLPNVSREIGGREHSRNNSGRRNHYEGHEDCRPPGGRPSQPSPEMSP